MPPIGETLREARMRQRLDIADVEARTKIRAKYLRALENEEWSLLPGPTFVRTFLRTYAEVVGVDPHVLVEEYRVNHEPREDYDFQPLAPVPRDARRGPRRQGGGRRMPSGPPGRGPVALLVVGVLLAFVFALGVLGGEDDGGEGGDGGDTPAPTTVERRTDRDDRRARPRPAPAGANVRIVPTEPTYACVDTGPGTPVVYEGTLEGERTFRDPRRLRLNLGKRTVTITLNGRAVAVTPSAEPLGLALTPRGSTELPLGSRPCA